jgi:hypothetical protein
MYLNRLTLIGFLGGDAEIKTGNIRAQQIAADQGLVG